jgi:phosphohistidine phosphatase SixA
MREAIAMRRRALLWALTPAGASVAWARVSSERVLVIRHATTEPGVGDPPGYRLGRCETQRNLSAAGRDEARAFGLRLAALGWRPERVLSSRWCRCLDTAALIAQALDAPPVEPWSALDSFFDAREREPAQSAQLRARLRERSLPRQLWVTHQVNITALAGRPVAMGEALWLATRADGTIAARAFDE